MKTNFTLRLVTQGALRYRLNVGWSVYQGQFTIGSRLGNVGLDGRYFHCQAVSQNPVLAHRKSVALRKRQYKLV